MTRAALLLGLLTTSASAEPRHLPPGLQAVEILEGEARLIIAGTPEDAPTRLPRGVFFTEAGYKGLLDTTLRLQDDLEALRRTATAPCPEVAPMPPLTVTRAGWSTQAVVIVFLAGLMVGASGALILTK